MAVPESPKSEAYPAIRENNDLYDTEVATERVIAYATAMLARIKEKRAELNARELPPLVDH